MVKKHTAPRQRPKSKPLFSSLLKRAVLISCLALLYACSGGGSDAGPKVIVSGIATYTSYKLSTSTGLDYSAATEKPIRGAVIVLQDTNGKVVDSGNTNAEGKYALTAPADSTVRIVVKAALGNAASPHTKIVDNTNNAALYAMFFNVTTDMADTTASFNANSGWNGERYATNRLAAPFALLDVIYQAQQMVLAADSRASFPQLIINWSTNNKPASGNFADGDIGTSHYNSNGQLYILGAEDNDTDEYDSHVIAHEWSHYFEANFSRSDSLGGEHAAGDILDPTVAFGEGFGNALAGMVMEDAFYIDSAGLGQATTNIVINLELNSISSTTTDTQFGSGNTNTLLDGYYSEASIQEVLYDLYDAGEDDDDTLALGFSPIYNVITNGQKNTPAFTSIFSFLHYLKQAIPDNSAAIASLALAENIAAGDEYEATTTQLYTTVPFNDSVVTIDVAGFPLQTWSTFGPITKDNPGNKLFNQLYFQFTATANGCYTVEATPTAGGDLIILDINDIVIDQQEAGVAENMPATYKFGEKGVFAVGSLGGTERFTVRIFSSPAAC